MGKIIYRAKMFNLEEATSTARGRKVKFFRIVGPNTVTVLPMFDDGKIILERQYRYSINKYLYELPAGHIDKGEKSTKHAAIRELEEETGYRANRLKLMFKAYPSPGSKTELAYYYFAQGLTKTETHLEEDEIIETKIVTFTKALDMVRKNQIQDLKSIAALMFYQTMFR